MMIFEILTRMVIDKVVIIIFFKYSFISGDINLKFFFSKLHGMDQMHTCNDLYSVFHKLLIPDELFS